MGMIRTRPPAPIKAAPGPAPRPSGPIRATGLAEVVLNGVLVQLSAPIPGRPHLFRIVTADGRTSVLGDGGDARPEHGDILRTVADPRFWRRLLEPEENQSLTDAENDLEAARRMVDRDAAAMAEAQQALAACDPETPEAAQLQWAVDARESSWLQSRDLERHALQAYGRTRTRLLRLAMQRA